MKSTTILSALLISALTPLIAADTATFKMYSNIGCQAADLVETAKIGEAFPHTAIAEFKSISVSAVGQELINEGLQGYASRGSGFDANDDPTKEPFVAFDLVNTAGNCKDLEDSIGEATLYGLAEARCLNSLFEPFGDCGGDSKVKRQESRVKRAFKA